MMDVEDDTQPDDTLEHEDESYSFSVSHSTHTAPVALLPVVADECAPPAAFATPGPSVTPATAFDEALRNEKVCPDESPALTPEKRPSAMKPRT